MSDLDTKEKTEHAGTDDAKDTTKKSDESTKKVTKNERQDEDNDFEDESEEKSRTKKSRENLDNHYEEIKRLRNEIKRRRLEVEDVKELAQKAFDHAEKASKESTQLKKTYEQRLIDAELKIAADEFGLQDFDAFKMADLSGVKVNEKGEITGIKEVVETLKTSKPYLFKTDTTTSSKVKIPNQTEQDKKPASLIGEDPKVVNKKFEDFLRNI